MGLRRILVSRIPKAGEHVELDEGETQHVLKVLRLGSGEFLEALDGRGNFATVALENRGKRAFVSLAAGRSASPERAPGVVPLVIGLSILKGDAMSWAIEKLCELGVRSVQPIVAELSVIRLNKEPSEFQARWQETADQALKQCGRLVRMDILPPLKLETILLGASGPGWVALDVESESVGLPKSLPASLMIGPEGGWSPKEREMLHRDPNVRVVRLPTNTLRAETAAVAAASALALNPS